MICLACLCHSRACPGHNWHQHGGAASSQGTCPLLISASSMLNPEDLGFDPPAQLCTATRARSLLSNRTY